MRVHRLLIETKFAPSPLLEVIMANGKAIFGQLLRAVVGNTQNGSAWKSFGSMTLATEHGKIEIDYLDIVTLQEVLAQPESVPPPLATRGRRRRDTAATAFLR
jgi:hypothetical protein